MDPRLQLLSYSSLLTLHSCPRRYQLYKLGTQAEDNDADGSQNVTFAFGHIIGDGVQQIFAGTSLDDVILNMFLGWHADLEDANDKQKKSFYLAVAAILKIHHMRQCGFLDDWEVMEYRGKPAMELGFRITLPDGFRLRGYVDAVLRNRTNGKIMVLECKTSSASSINPITYKNSAQAVGYSVVLDVIAPEISSYDVLYLIYLSKGMEYETYTFPKSYLQRALWVQELLLDIETIKLYDNSGIYPMRGESCFSFYRECEYMNTCTLKTQHLTQPYDPAVPLDKEEYDVELTLMDLVNAQLRKNTGNALTFEELRNTETGDQML